MSNPTNFDQAVQGKRVQLVHLHSDRIDAYVTNYGAILTALRFKGRDLVLGYDTLREYMASPEKYFGAIVGPICGRVSNGRFSIGSKNFQLVQNAGQACLHSDALLSARVFDIRESSETKLVLETEVADGEKGFPGPIEFRVTYEVKDSDLLITMEGKPLGTAAIAMTAHPFFNFGDGNVQDAEATIPAEKIVTLTEQCTSGDFLTVQGTCFDLNAPHVLKDVWHRGETGSELEKRQIELGRGVDHTYVTPGFNGQIRQQAVVKQNGITLTASSNQPGMHFYTGGWLSEALVGKGGKPCVPRGAFCLEAQNWSDAVNHQDAYPRVVFGPGEQYRNSVRYHFE